jgi:hypothetical protein
MRERKLARHFATIVGPLPLQQARGRFDVACANGIPLRSDLWLLPTALILERMPLLQPAHQWLN